MQWLYVDAIHFCLPEIKTFGSRPAGSARRSLISWFLIFYLIRLISLIADSNNLKGTRQRGE